MKSEALLSFCCGAWIFFCYCFRGMERAQQSQLRAAVDTIAARVCDNGHFPVIHAQNSPCAYTTVCLAERQIFALHSECCLCVA